MPSASLVSTSGSSSVATTTSGIATTTTATMETVSDTPLGLAIQVLEKKVRNLEKRKAKLDGYRADYQRGKELNDDQKSAIAKYDEVIQNLDFARELSSQFKSLSQEEDKNKKKQLKKEQQEKARSEVQKLAQVFEIQDLLWMMTKPKVRNDFQNGNHNAIKLTKEQIASIEEFSKLVHGSNRKLTDPEYEKLLNNSAENLSFFLEGKASKKVGKTNFKDLKSLLESIKSCGYFQNQGTHHDDDEGKKAKKEAPVQNGDDHAAEKKVEAQPEVAAVVVPAVPEPAKASSSPPLVEQPQALVDLHPRDQAFINPQPVLQPEIQQTRMDPILPVTSQPAPQHIDFFQDSQIDMESPHMDPAVVMVQHSPPQHMIAMMTAAGGVPPLPTNSNIPSQTYTNQMYIPPTTLAAIQQHHDHHQQMYSNFSQLQIQQQQQQQQQQHQPEQDQHYEYQEENFKRLAPQENPEKAPESSKPIGFDESGGQPQQPTDTMANIDDWDNEVAGGSGNEDSNRSGGWRGGRGSRSRGTGNGYRGRGGGYRGGRDGERDGNYRGMNRGNGYQEGDRDNYRGGNDGYRGGERDNNGYRGGDRDGGYRGDRGDRGAYRGRGGERGDRRGNGNSSRGGGGAMPPRDREFRGGRGTGAPRARGYQRTNGYQDDQ